MLQAISDRELVEFSMVELITGDLYQGVCGGSKTWNLRINVLCLIFDCSFFFIIVREFNIT